MIIFMMTVGVYNSLFFSIAVPQKEAVRAWFSSVTQPHPTLLAPPHAVHAFLQGLAVLTPSSLMPVLVTWVSLLEWKVAKWERT